MFGFGFVVLVLFVLFVGWFVSLFVCSFVFVILKLSARAPVFFNLEGPLEKCATLFQTRAEVQKSLPMAPDGPTALVRPENMSESRCEFPS